MPYRGSGCSYTISGAIVKAKIMGFSGYGMIIGREGERKELKKASEWLQGFCKGN